jgi:hypothetical protein
MTRGLVAVLVLAAAAGGAAGAQGDPDLGAVYVCNEVLIRIRTEAAGQSLEQRREAVRLRLVQAYATQRTAPADVTLRQVPGGWAIYVGGQLRVTVTPQDARANGTTEAALARLWAARVRDLLGRCPLEGSPTRRP